MRIKPLPPLNSLVAFEAAARHLSFTKASQDLHVTQGAISRQIRHLEEFLGQNLFVREKRALSLTNTGLEYFASIQQSLTDIASATNNALQFQNDRQVTIFTTNAMASFWLLPRFSAFQEQYPDIDLRILAVDSLRNVHHTEFDIALFYCRSLPADLDATPLFNETVFPVCSPAYLEKQRNLHTQQSSHLDLSKGTLLSLEVNEEWVTWQDWFNECGVQQTIQESRKLNINNYPLVIQAALNGQGFALGWANLVDDYLASGLLVRPVDNSFTTQSQFYILQPNTQLRPKEGVALFRQWLLENINC
jgi:DNA-binding transcriptional LysR family regulator